MKFCPFFVLLTLSRFTLCRVVDRLSFDSRSFDWHFTLWSFDPVSVNPVSVVYLFIYYLCYVQGYVQRMRVHIRLSRKFTHAVSLYF